MGEISDGHGLVAGLDSTAAMLRAESEHLDATLRALVTRLSSVPGLTLAVSHRHGRIRRILGDLPYIADVNRRSNPIHRIVVTVGPTSYWLLAEPSSITCGTTVHGATTEEGISFTAWASALFAEIAGQNLVTYEALVALRDLVEHDRVG
ncbi:MAG TPA: hypothetical protein VG365_06065 [Solirubrobacteraceae bacterium]|jgi:hypothetical protein|nr:hypothetical protein [Solirubrobacteraceae bacterium]